MGLTVSEEFLNFFPNKPMGANDSLRVASLGPKGLTCRIYVAVGLMVSEEKIFLFFFPL